MHSIYFDYYYEWDSHFFSNNADQNNSYNKLQQAYEKISSLLTDEPIILNGYPFSKMSNEDKVIPNDKLVNKKLWQALFFTMAFGILALGLILAIKKMNVELAIAGAVFVILLFTWLAFLSFSENKAYSILLNIPVISKLFENIK